MLASATLALTKLLTYKYYCSDTLETKLALLVIICNSIIIKLIKYPKVILQGGLYRYLSKIFADL